MKQLFILVAFLSIFILTGTAQNTPVKPKYDLKSYTYMPGDPYDPTNISITSAIVPGLGQMVCNEGIKGLCFLAGYAGGWALAISGIKLSLRTVSPEPDWSKVGPIAQRRMRAGLVIAATSWLWSMIDAPRTAKIENLKFREKNGIKGVVSFKPCFEPSLTANHNLPAGVSFNIRF